MARYTSRFMIFSSVSLPEVKNYDIFAFFRVVLRFLCQTVRVKEQVFSGYVHIVPDRETERYRKCTSSRSSAHTRNVTFHSAELHCSAPLVKGTVSAINRALVLVPVHIVFFPDNITKREFSENILFPTFAKEIKIFPDKIKTEKLSLCNCEFFVTDIPKVKMLY